MLQDYLPPFVPPPGFCFLVLTLLCMCFGKNSHKYYVIVCFLKCGSTTLVNRFFFCLLISQIKNCSRHQCITKFRFVLPSHPLKVTVLVHVKWILLYSYNRPNLKFCRLLFLSIETRKSRHGSVLQKLVSGFELQRTMVRLAHGVRYMSLPWGDFLVNQTLE